MEIFLFFSGETEDPQDIKDTLQCSMQASGLILPKFLAKGSNKTYTTITRTEALETKLILDIQPNWKTLVFGCCDVASLIGRH